MSSEHSSSNPIERIRRSFMSTGAAVRGRFWAIPLLAAIVLGLVGFIVRNAVESEMANSISTQLEAVRDANVEALTLWLKSQENIVVGAAKTEAIAEPCRQLAAFSKAKNAPADRVEQLRKALAEEFAPWFQGEAFQGFIVVNQDWQVIASNHAELIGKSNPVEYADFLSTTFDGKATVSRPFPSIILLPDANGNLRAGQPTMYAAAPIWNGDEVVAVLGFRIRPERDFSRIMQVSRFGDSGESYAFDREGLLLSQSRFDKELKHVGLIADNSQSVSLLGLTLKDPGVNLSNGKRPKQERDSLPLTLSVQSAINSKESGVDVSGYRDYLGIPSVGAWTWLPEYRIGVVTEVNRDDAFRAADIVRKMFWTMIALLIISVFVILLVTWLLTRWQKAARSAVLAAQQLGQYQLEVKIGSGAMGTVYRANHSMLRRPTAVKLLNSETVNDITLKRFEREVQLTSQLNHPNTVAIYDFGRTPEGVFYYAMEYLDGITLQQLVDGCGPLAPGRSIHLLRQICGSLAEAHALGLIHRDIKPANVLVNRRGGQSDVIKVVDFGLVKDTQRDDLHITRANALTGTPMYMAPEAIERGMQVDHRVDLYAVGAVGYFLLTGTGLFQTESLFDLLRLQATALPDLPSQRLGSPIPSDLEHVIMSCLSKDPNDRPATARELERQLAACADANQWTDSDAERWWDNHAVTGCGSAPLRDTSQQTSGATLISSQEFHRP